jgi:hypothetical protein
VIEDAIASIASVVERDVMASLIHEIENNEALLLMFISGELPAEDRAEVEQMLAGDAGLRDELARIVSAYDFAMDSLATLDADRTAIPGENHAIRQAKRAMKQWQNDRLHRQPTPVHAPARRYPAWAYGSAVAAMLLIGMLTYWGIVGESSNSGGTVASGTQPALPSTGTGDDAKATADANLLDHLMDHSAVDHTDKLAVAESQAKDLVARSDSSAVASSILFDDNAR